MPINQSTALAAVCPVLGEFVTLVSTVVFPVSRSVLVIVSSFLLDLNANTSTKMTAKSIRNHMC